eukprot:scaffold1709_cov95-Cylindrotheca_fusiformis.AAC.1
MFNRLLLSLLLILLVHDAGAMQIHFGNITCKEQAITLAFDRICSDSNTCTVGTKSNILGRVNYYGLYDQYGITSDSTVYIDMNISLYSLGSDTFGKKISQLGQPLYNATIYDMTGAPVCQDSMTTYNDGDYACPSSGAYKFHSSVTIPHPGGSGFKTWAYTGYNGTGQFAIYKGPNYRSKLLGLCYFTLTTSQEAKAGVATPSGRSAMIALLVAGGTVTLLGLISCYCAWRRGKGKKSVVRKVAPYIPPEQKVDGHFRIMEEETLGEAQRKGWFSQV